MGVEDTWAILRRDESVTFFTLPTLKGKPLVVMAVGLPPVAMALQGLSQAVLVVLLNEHPRPSFALDTCQTDPTVLVLKERFHLDDVRAKSHAPHLTRLVEKQINTRDQE